MKTTTQQLKTLMALSALTLMLPASAIENPAAEDALKQAPKERANKPAADDAPEAEKKAVKKTPMLGLGGHQASQTLSLHLGLKQGQGLTIYHIVPGSAAAKAGLETHDVITEFQGKKIGSQQDLRDAVLAQKPGDEVTLNYIHRGKSEEKKVVLGERANLPRVRQGDPMRPFGLFPRGLRNLPEADRKRIEKMMQDNLKQWEKQLGQNPDGGVPPLADLRRLFQGAQGARMPNFLGVGGASITMMDQEGSVSMKTIDGKKEVIVKDKSGKVIFEGPYQTEQDKAAVPDDVRDRLKKLNFAEGKNGGFRLQIGPGGMMPPHMHQPEDDVDEDAAAE